MILECKIPPMFVSHVHLQPLRHHAKKKSLQGRRREDTGQWLAVQPLRFESGLADDQITAIVYLASIISLVSNQSEVA